MLAWSSATSLDLVKRNSHANSVYMLNCAHASTFSERGTRNGCILSIKHGLTCYYTNAELSKTQPTFQEEQSPAAKSIFNSKPLGKWSFHTV